MLNGSKTEQQLNKADGDQLLSKDVHRAKQLKAKRKVCDLEPSQLKDVAKNLKQWKFDMNDLFERTKLIAVKKKRDEEDDD